LCGHLSGKLLDQTYFAFIKGGFVIGGFMKLVNVMLPYGVECGGRERAVFQDPIDGIGRITADTLIAYNQTGLL
jgi:hypothetical protein